MGCFAGALDFVGGTRRNTWGSAVCGALPIGLAAMIVDTGAVGLCIAMASADARFLGHTFDGWVGFVSTLPQLLPAFCSMLATIGIFDQQRSVRLARVAFYSFTFVFILQLLILPADIAIFLIYFPHHIGVPLALSVIIFVALYGTWSLPIRRSLYKILEAGGTGWEFQSAEELLVLSHSKDVEEGIEEPLISAPAHPSAYI